MNSDNQGNDAHGDDYGDDDYLRVNVDESFSANRRQICLSAESFLIPGKRLDPDEEEQVTVSVTVVVVVVEVEVMVEGNVLGGSLGFIIISSLFVPISIPYCRNLNMRASSSNVFFGERKQKLVKKMEKKVHFQRFFSSPSGDQFSISFSC